MKYSGRPQNKGATMRSCHSVSFSNPSIQGYKGKTSCEEFGKHAGAKKQDYNGPSIIRASAEFVVRVGIGKLAGARINGRSLAKDRRWNPGLGDK